MKIPFVAFGIFLLFGSLGALELGDIGFFRYGVQSLIGIVSIVNGFRF